MCMYCSVCGYDWWDHAWHQVKLGQAWHLVKYHAWQPVCRAGRAMCGSFQNDHVWEPVKPPRVAHHLLCATQQTWCGPRYTIAWQTPLWCMAPRKICHACVKILVSSTVHRINPYATMNSIIELLFIQRKPQDPYITLKYKNQPGKAHTCNLTTYQSIAVCCNATQIANLLKVEVIVSISGILTIVHAHIRVWVIIQGVKK